MKGDNGNITSRIIGGRPTKSHPWQVSLSLGPGIALCGGTIISKYHVLNRFWTILDASVVQVL